MKEKYPQPRVTKAERQQLDAHLEASIKDIEQIRAEEKLVVQRYLRRKI